jgi:hypothetical protein
LLMNVGFTQKHFDRHRAATCCIHSVLAGVASMRIMCVVLLLHTASASKFCGFPRICLINDAHREIPEAKGKRNLCGAKAHGHERKRSLIRR